MTFGNRALAVFVLLGCAGMSVVGKAQQAVSPDHPHAKKVQKAKPKHEAAPVPPPAEPLHVTYEDGLLSISSHDALLSDILTQVRQHTGATIKAPKDVNDRVTVELGPGPAAKVLSDLLEETRFNYLIAGSPNKPGAVQSIQLTEKPSPTVATETPASAPGRPVAAKATAKDNLDEGVWDDVEAGTPATAPAKPPAAAPAPPDSKSSPPDAKPAAPDDTAARPPQ